MRRLIFAGLATIVIAGCATSSSTYLPPNTAKVINTKTIDKPFDVVWDRLVRELSSDFYVINNIDKNSRLINVSFSSTRPSAYVDCGMTSRSFSNLRGQVDGKYMTADAADYSESVKAIMYNIHRTTKLSGRANIYVAPEGSGTTISVNTKYILEINKTAVALDGRSFPLPVNTVDFSTKSGSDAAPDGVRCESRGTVEDKILSMAQ